MEVKLKTEEVNKSLLNATCPDCRGPMSVSAYGGLREYSCLVGHRYSANGLLQAHSDAQEKSLWAAVVALEEAGNLVNEVAGDFPREVADRLQEQAARKREQAEAIRRILQELEPFETKG
jgi:two-component system, chemotaxis family, protein-glutamate methylesterase/glutaminase